MRAVQPLLLKLLKRDIFHILALFARTYRSEHSRSFPKIYQGRLSIPLPRGAFPLKHEYSLKLHCSLLMYADLSRYLVAVDQALILQRNSMPQASRVWAWKTHLKRLTIHWDKVPGRLCKWTSKKIVFLNLTLNIVTLFLFLSHCTVNADCVRKDCTYLLESSLFMQDLKEMNFSSTLMP